MANTFQVTKEGIGYMRTEVLPSGSAGFVDMKHFADKTKLLQFLDMGYPSPELRAAWEERLDKGIGFTVDL